ncbi:MAG: hypothetical protein QNJ68_02445 [Microcoleaceae cyanobacterium MO_207.B10]|nr:hypothetical protein [Microcoleaceae cyanobacterium MO_207.B10]
MSDLPPIYFYLPKADWVEDMPDTPNFPWTKFGIGRYAWTLQTYLHLKADDFPCELVKTIPTEGIVIAHRDSFSYRLRPTSKVLMICIKADKNPHPYAQLHIVQNPQDVKNLSNSYYMPHWIQPGLVPRNPGRGDRFENIGYFGVKSNLAPELKATSWSKQLEELGLNWEFIPRHRWYDYSNIDAIVAVRSFQRQDYTHKPASKLYNAWHAGVPAILGKELAFQSERKSELDYFEVSSVNDTIAALKRLKDNPQLCQKVRENAQHRSQETKSENTIKQWRNFLTRIATPAYYKWVNAPEWQKQLYKQKCFLNIKIDGLKRKFGLA